MHIGAGVSYYTSILAEVVGAAGRVTAIEFDAEFAAANFARTSYVRAVHGDGTQANCDSYSAASFSPLVSSAQSTE